MAHTTMSGVVAPAAKLWSVMQRAGHRDFLEEKPDDVADPSGCGPAFERSASSRSQIRILQDS